MFTNIIAIVAGIFKFIGFISDEKKLIEGERLQASIDAQKTVAEGKSANDVQNQVSALPSSAVDAGLLPDTRSDK